MKKARERQHTQAPGNQGPRTRRPPKMDREERHQVTRELAPTDQERQSESMAPGGSASAAGASEDNPARRAKRDRKKGQPAD